MLNAKGDYALYVDADLSLPIQNLEKFLKYIPKYDIVIASRKVKDSNIEITQSIFRKSIGNMYSLIASLFIQDIKDTQCGFKLFNVKKTRILFKKQSLNRFSFDVEILYLAKKEKLKIKEVGIRLVNSSKTSIHLLRDPIYMLIELMKLGFNIISGKY